MTTRFLSSLLILLGTVLPAAAQTSNPPRFLLESIVVEGVQRDTVRRIVTSESLLDPGREYTEQELREAVYRVKRLPFVMDADFSLRKGGERGSYQLVITVEETRLLFFSFDAGGAYDAEDTRIGPDDERINWGVSTTLGGRWFVGSQGLVFASVQGFDEVGPAAVQAGYTHYDLFGRGGFASVAMATDVADEFSGESYQGTFSMGLPIVGNHSFRADLGWLHLEDDRFGLSRDETQRLNLAWIYDTTDDPLFTTTGTRVSASAGYGESERSFSFEEIRVREDSNVYDLGIVGRRHWALTRRQSVAGQLSGYWAETDYNGTVDGFEGYGGAAAFIHSTDLWGFEKTERFGDFRWENTIDIFMSDSDSSSFHSSSTDGRLTTSLVFRNAWGVTRLSFSYIDNLEQDFRFQNVL